jgi:glycosyltransferase involved in cell wall biosynthesis
MHSTSPVFSVVVPLYNTERYIAEALDSVRRQDFADFEVIIVNDQSSDNGPAIAARFAAADTRFRVVSQENRGLAGARNTGIRESRGRYVALLDADDLWEATKLARHYAHLEANPDVGVSYAASRMIDEDGRLLRATQWPRMEDVDDEHVFCRNPVGNGSAAVLRRSALDDIAFAIDAPEGERLCWFDESFRQSEDIECWCRMAATTEWRFAGIPAALTRYRIASSGLSANTERQFETWCRFRDKLRTIAPGLVERAGNRAEAYQLRYLARRAAVGGNGAKALSLLWNAISQYPRIIAEEPRRTVITGGLSMVATLLPTIFFGQLLEMASKPRSA